MEFGVCLPNFGPKASPTGIVSIAQAAEELGFQSVWATDHVVVPKDHSYPYGRLFEPLTLLSFLAAKTRDVRLGTSILVLAMRNPVVVAKEVAAIDILSEGRVILGLGAGWLAKEFEFLGAGFDRRGSYLDESIQLLRALWSEGNVNFHEKFFNITEAVFEPKPLQRGGPPIWIGGNSESALRRAARHGDGWHPLGPDPRKLKGEVEALRKLTDRRIVIVPRMTVELNDVKPKIYKTASGETRYAISGDSKAVRQDIDLLGEAGAEGLVSYFGDKDTKAYVEQMRAFAKEIMPSY